MSKPVHYIGTPPRKPAKLCSQVFHSLMWLYCFNQSQCLDISNIFLYPYLSISAKSQYLYKYNYWLNKQKYIQNVIFFQVCFRISYLLKPCMIKYYSDPLLITFICINISSALKNWQQHTDTVSTISATKSVCVCGQPPERYEDFPCYSVSVVYLGQWGRMDGTMVVSTQWYWFLGHTVIIKTLQFVLTKIWLSD